MNSSLFNHFVVTTIKRNKSIYSSYDPLKGKVNGVDILDKHARLKINSWKQPCFKTISRIKKKQQFNSWKKVKC